MAQAATASSAAFASSQPASRPSESSESSEGRAFDLLQRVAVGWFAAMLGLAILMQPAGLTHPFPVLVFLAIAVASELLPVTLPDGSAEITLTPILVWGVVALFGPAYGVGVAFFAAFLGSLLHKLVFQHADSAREGFWRYLLYNSCIIGSNIGVGAVVYQALGGVHLQSAGHGALPFSRVAFPLFAGTFVALSMDLFFYAVGSAAADSQQDEDVSLESIWMRAKVLWCKNALAFLPSYFMLTPFAFVLAYLYVWKGMGFWGILPILIPFFSLRQTLNLLMANIRTYRQTITTLATLMQKYHPYTRGHLKRVADLSVRLARELRLPASSQQWIWEAGLLHDIGKVGVPEQILDKTTKLTDEEWGVIREHPAKSAQILGQLDFLDSIVPWVKHHHERVDGSGYPDGLKGTDIPIEAAIIAVADAFDAMTGTRDVGNGRHRRECDACGWRPAQGVEMPDDCPDCGATLTRVYRKPMSVEEGIEELRYGVGTQFAPRVVRAFIRMMAKEETVSDG